MNIFSYFCSQITIKLENETKNSNLYAALIDDYTMLVGSEERALSGAYLY